MTGGVTRVLLLRHGQSTWNAEGRWQGRSAPPLSELGTAHIAAAADAAAAGSVDLDGADVAVASDLQRARRTAEILAERLGWGDVETYPGLRERDVGEFTGLTRAEIEARWPGILSRVPVEPPGGEPRAAVITRAVATLHRIAERHCDRSVIAVTHGALIRAVEAHLGVQAPGAPPNLTGRWISIEGGTLSPGPRAAIVGDAPPDAAPTT